MKKTAVLLVFTLAFMLLFSSCASFMGGDRDDAGYAGGYDDSYASMDPSDSGESDADGSSEDVESDDDAVRLPSGMMTAAAWNDNTYYDAWLELFSQNEDGNGKFYEYTDPALSWGYDSTDRVSVLVRNGETPLAGAKVVAVDGQGNPVFSAVTDATGTAYLFPGAESGTVTVTYGEISATASFNKDERSVSVDLSADSLKLNVIEIMLVVDVTGSMSDELEFLEAELTDVISRIAANDSSTAIKLAMLFYRDTGDGVPFDYYDFTDVTTEQGLSSMLSKLKKQRASGGGDYPEAVDDALEMAVNKQWSTGATTKIIFQVLDAPAHNKSENKEKLASAVETAAERGIRFCPIICSGASTDTEYTMREAAIYTGGTFIFVTDDSGIGGSHHDPGLPNATVELLNSLMVRLVKGYHTGIFEEPVYWKHDPGLATNQ